MERLTKYDTDGQAMMDCEKCKADWAGKHGKPMVDCTALYCRNRLKDRLAAYEDTGLTPELVQEIAELAIWIHENGLEKIKKWIKADKKGCLIIVDNTPRQVNPCDTCESGWATITTTGYDSCFNHCEKLAEYRKREG